MAHWIDYNMNFKKIDKVRTTKLVEPQHSPGLDNATWPKCSSKSTKGLCLHALMHPKMHQTIFPL